jgi:transposase
MERLNSINLYSSYTKRFEHYIYNLCHKSTIKAASEIEDLPYDATEGIYFRETKRLVESRNSKNTFTEVLGIDEISRKKGHKDFVIVLSDIKRGIVIDVLEDRKKKTLEKYFDSKSEEFKAHIKTVSMDMWGPYRSVVEEKLSHADVVADRFHVMKNLNECLNTCRKAVQNELDKDTRKLLKDSKWVLLKNKSDLDEDSLNKLESFYQISEKLKEAHILKEYVRDIFESSENKDVAEVTFNIFELLVMRSSVKKYFDTFIVTLSNWREQILNYFDDKVTNGFVEGMNNKIKVLKRKAYGILNFEHFRIRILDECG